MPKLKFRLIDILVTIAILIGLSIFVYSRALYYHTQFYWDHFFADVVTVGERCEVGVGKNAQNLTPEALIGYPPETLTSMAMPYKGVIAAEKPKTSAGDYLYTKCLIDLSQLTDRNFGWMRLHYLHGDSAVALNGDLRLVQGDLGTAEFPLLPNDRIKDAALVIVSVPNALKQNRLGLPTGMPLIVTDKRSGLSLPNLAATLDFQLKPAYWLNWSLVFLSFFAITWLGGLRRDDVAWLAVTIALNACMNVAIFSPENSLTPMRQFTSGTSYFAAQLGLGIFVLSFLKLVNTTNFLVFAFILATSAYSVGLYFSNGSDFQRFVSIYLPPIVGILLYMIAMIGGSIKLKRKTIELPRRALFVIIFCGIIAIFKTIDLIIFYKVFFTFSELVTEIAITGFASFLIFDLVIAYKKYAEERAQHLETMAKSREFEAIVATSQMLAHDIRRPFSLAQSALSFAHTELSQSAPDSTSANILSKALVQVQTAMGQTTAMLDELMERGREQKLTISDENLAELVESSLELCKANESHHTVVTEGLDHLTVTLDAHKVIRLLANVVENALQAMGDKPGTIRVSSNVHKRKGKLEVSVHNTGTYISEDERERIFSPFYTKGKRGGTGLGLAIAQRVMLAHGGAITCTSDPEAGTTFMLTFPFDKNVAPTNEKAAPTAALKSLAKVDHSDQHRIRVALIEDDLFLSDIWKARYEDQKDIELLIFSDPNEFFVKQDEYRHHGTRDFDLVFCDYFFDEIEDVTGATLARTLRNRGFSGKICLFSDADLSADEFQLFDLTQTKGDLPDLVAMAGKK